MRHDGWLGLGIRGLLVRGVLGLLVLLRGLHVTRGENKNWLVDHDIRPLKPSAHQAQEMNGCTTRLTTPSISVSLSQICRSRVAKSSCPGLSMTLIQSAPPSLVPTASTTQSSRAHFAPLPWITTVLC